MSNGKIADWRAEIDVVDTELVRLLNRRVELARALLALKRHQGLPICDPARELEVLCRASSKNAGPLKEEAVRNVFRQIINETRKAEEQELRRLQAEGDCAMTSASLPRVAFQGERGAFSDEAAQRLFPQGADLVPCPTFEALFRAVDDDKADFAVAPLENTLAGSVHRCYDLLLESDLHIVGEMIAPIVHHLIGCEGASLETVRVVESHPVALAQCERFFAEHPRIKPVAGEDTAGSVRKVMEKRNPGYAAIAGALAAKTYGAKILAEHLEDHAENYTRFALLTDKPADSAEANKLSLVLALAHRPGALSHALEPFAQRSIDLLKIESRPVKGKPWEYRFYLDLAASTRDPELQQALRELEERTQRVCILGCYRSAKGICDTNLKELAKQ